MNLRALSPFAGIVVISSCVGFCAESGGRQDFALESPLASDLSGQSRGILANGIAEVLASLPGRHGELGEAAKTGFEGLDFLHDIGDSLQSIRLDPYDPDSDWDRFSIGLDVVNLLGPGEIIPGVAGGLLTVGNLAKSIGEATRSRILQNRAMDLVNFGGAVLDSPVRYMQEEMEKNYGHFSLSGERFAAQGEWHLDHHPDGVFGRNSVSALWAGSKVQDVRTANGSVLSGVFGESERREERGANLFNFYEPTSISISRRSRESYRLTLDGSRLNASLTPSPVPRGGGRAVDPGNLPPPNRFSDLPKKPPGSPSSAMAGGKRQGGSLDKPSSTPVSGVKMEMHVGQASFKKDTAGSTGDMRKDALDGRPPGSLTWPAK